MSGKDVRPRDKRKTCGGITPQQIIKLRKELHCSQDQFGKLLGVARYSVYRWEAGTMQPSASCHMILTSIFQNLENRPEWQRVEIMRMLRDAVQFGGMSSLLNQLFNLAFTVHFESDQSNAPIASSNSFLEL